MIALVQATCEYHLILCYLSPSLLPVLLVAMSDAAPTPEKVADGPTCAAIHAAYVKFLLGSGGAEHIDA